MGTIVGQKLTAIEEFHFVERTISAIDHPALQMMKDLLIDVLAVSYEDALRAGRNVGD